MRPDIFPRWLDHKPSVNLREVAPNLYVGAVDAILVSSRYVGVVDLFGSTLERAGCVAGTRIPLLSVPFQDGADFPAGALDRINAFCLAHRQRGPVLIHCAAGLSRSASAAVAVMARQDAVTLREGLRRVQTGTGKPHYPVPATLMSATRWALRGQELPTLLRFGGLGDRYARHAVSR